MDLDNPLALLGDPTGSARVAPTKPMVEYVNAFLADEEAGR